jgi:hypothetical protein
VASQKYQRERPALNITPVAKDSRRQLVAELAQEDWSVPTPAALAQQLVQEELHARSNTRVIRSTTGTPIIIRKPDSTPTPPAQDVAVLETSGGRSDLLATALVTRNPDPSNLRPLWLNGQVEMTEGLAFVGPETQMTIKRVFNGYVFEQGRIWVSEGRFEIRVKEPIGYLVAELRTREGRVLGRGEINLMDLRQLPAKTDRVADLHIPLRPTADGATIHAISGYSHGPQKIAVASARVEIQSYSQAQKTDDEGMVSEPSLHRDSSFVAQVSAKDHWPSLVVGQAREPQDVRLFASKLVGALIGLTTDRAARSDRREASSQSIVWGRLTQDGQAAVGAQVEMAGGYKPIYFNDMYLPDPHLNATGSNGLFAFVRVPRGTQALRVTSGGHTYPAQVFPTENQQVSYVELEIRAKAVSEFKVFNAFDLSRPVSASIRLVGNDETLAVGKDDFVEYSVAANPFMVEADAGGEFETTRVTVTGTPHVIHVPLVQRQWLYQISQDKRINQSPDRGVIVGLIDDPGYEVELTGFASGETMQIVYVDAAGKPVDSRVGVAGGGFVIFNAPQGLQTLYVHGAQMRQTFSQIVVAEPQFVSVVTH